MKRPLKELAKDGLFQVPRGKIIDGDALRNMTETEKYAHGIDIPEHNKFENGRLVPKTPAEMVADGEMTALEAAERRLAMELAKLNNEEARLRLEIDEGYAEVRKNKLRALLAVREQAGWPESVEWPA
jgi:hypothetical protein